MTDVLIYGAPEASPDLFHAIPVGIGDPFLYAEAGGRRVATPSVLDADKVAALGIEILDPSTLGADELFGQGLGRHEVGLEIALEVCESLPELPAAVEVAAYRIAVEALTNVARHASAERATVSMTAGGVLAIEIRDDGRSDADWVPGVGLLAMRERAAELGGTLVAAPTKDGGLVRAELPLAAA